MTREEAIKILRDTHDKALFSVRNALEILVPELADSKDERIRKFLINILSHGTWRKEWPFGPNEVVAYLEKQKEQKPAVSREEILHQLFQNGSITLSDYLYLTGEQKPAEWNDTDNIGWDEAFACVTRAEKAAKNEEELQNAVTAEKWLKEIKFKYCVHPQPKQEWSEEDKQMWMDIKCDLIHGSFIPFDKIEWLETRLKSFRPDYYGICNREQTRNLLKWKKADRDWDAGTIDFAVFHKNDGGDHEDWVSVEVTNRLYKGEYYIELSDLDKLPKED